MKINKRDRDVDYYSSYVELDNPNALRAKKSSNTVFLLCALTLGSMLLLLLIGTNKNDNLEEAIQKSQDYVADPEIVEAYAKKTEIQEKTKKILDYNMASETYLAQLEKGTRFSSEWVTFFNDAMNTAIGGGNKIQSFNYANGILMLDCVATNPESPKIFAQYLSEMTDDQGEKRFYEVAYAGFANQGDEFVFPIQITLWPDLQKQAQENQQAEQQIDVQ